MTRTTHETIHSYVTDMLALETHLVNTLEYQVDDVEVGHPRAAAALKELHQTAARHLTAIRALEESREDDLGVELSDLVKRFATTIAGLGTAAIDMLRSDKVPKNLRDDFAAFSMATIGYTMLYTTARALGEERVATLAESHLRDYAQAMRRLSELMPATVVAALRADGLPVEDGALAGIEDTVRQAWTR
jgi:ferritin-like metal-binding protein YciE